MDAILDSPTGAAPGERPSRRRLAFRWKAAIAVSLLAPPVAVTGFVVKTDAFAISPGPAEDVAGLIRVSASRHASEGAFLITTVSITLDTISVFEWVRAWVDPAIETVRREQLIAPGVTDEQQQQLNRADMEESKYFAAIVAMQAAGLDVASQPGARVLITFDDSPAAAVLKGGDVIVAVDGRPVATLDDVRSLVGAKPVGSTLRVEVVRDGARRTHSIRTVPDAPGGTRPVIGVVLAPAFRLPVEVAIDSRDIVGPSAGLTFALAIADALTEEDLTGGLRIATTGTIGLDGVVGPIGGVAEKARAAAYAGADLFIVPADNLREARSAAGRMRVLGVRNLREAIDFLQELPSAA